MVHKAFNICYLALYGKGLWNKELNTKTSYLGITIKSVLCMIFHLWRAGGINILAYGLCITIPSYAEMERDLQQHVLCCCSNIPIVFPAF